MIHIEDMATCECNGTPIHAHLGGGEQSQELSIHFYDMIYFSNKLQVNSNSTHLIR